LSLGEEDFVVGFFSALTWEELDEGT
jgi:hypothetical protein